MICEACKHPTTFHVEAWCVADVMYEDPTDAIPPFFLHCWCDGESGTVVLLHGARLREGEHPYKRVGGFEKPETPPL